MAVERAAGQREQTLLETAKASLPNDAPPEVVEQLAAVTAGVCYDVGDQDALQRALAELGESSQRLYSVGCHYREERGLFQCVELVPTRRSCNTLLSRGTTVLRGPHEDRPMLRIRFHGRGGQGMKTASRILGSAAFHAGYAVQDAPVYGVEHRGALMAAFTRTAHTPILERGAIVQADLVVVADDTLLTEPAAQPLAGCDTRCTLLVNSTKGETALQHSTDHSGRLLVADFTARAPEITQTLVGLSTALGIAAAHLVGLPLVDSLAGLNEELDDTRLSQVQRHANLQLAQATYTLVCSWEPIYEGREGVVVLATPLVEVPFAPPWRATPSISAAANSPARHTGSWRQFRPVLHPEHCSRCWVCFVRCPEAAITLDRNDYPIVDYDVCKGCLLCVHECPTHALSAEKEVR